jgi:hypothetical protein
MSEMTYFQVGGSLEYQHPTYVSRQADIDLYQSLKQGEFCYVLTARQMGKSSLRVQTMKKLNREGIHCASVDLTRIGNQATALEWYGGIVSELIRGFGLGAHINFGSWWSQQDALSAMQRFSAFLEEILLRKLTANIVIFFDEIDSILTIPFKDDFFALIRAFYNQRSDHTDYKRLTFCLLGATTPSALIQDKQRTPFNIGRAIELTGFTLTEARQALAQGLSATVKHPEVTIAEVLDWTNGQPFLTQKVCQLIVEHTEHRQPDIAQLVHTYIIDQWQSQDEPEHLRTIRDRLLNHESTAVQLFGLYRQILENGDCVADHSWAQITLRLSGLVIQQGNQLLVQNRIYATIFNQNWVKQTLHSLRPYGISFTAWTASNGHDQNYLLRGQALREAIAWAEGKTLSDQDYQFLTASQTLENELLNRIIWELISPLAVEEVSPQVAQVLKCLQQVSEDPSLALLSIERGSTHLILQGSQEGFVRIQQLLEVGRLSSLLNLPVLTVQRRSAIPVSPMLTSSAPALPQPSEIASDGGWKVFQQTIQAEYWVYWVIWLGTAIAAGLASFILLDPILDAL